MSNALSAREALRFPSLIPLCVCLLVLFSPTESKADIKPLSKVEDVVENAASSFKRIVADAEKALGRKLLFADAVLQSDIWLLRKELQGLMKETVKDLGVEKLELLNRVDANIKELRSELGILVKTKDTDVQRISSAINKSLIVGVRPSPIKFFPRVVKPSYSDGNFRIRVSGNQLDRATLTLKLTADGVPLSPSRKAEGLAEFNVSRAALPKASNNISYLSVTLIIEEDISFQNRIDKFLKKDTKDRLEKLFSKDTEKRAYPVALSLLPDHIGYARIFGIRREDRFSDVRDLKEVEDSVTSVSEHGKKQICVIADRDCKIDKPSIKYQVTGWNAYYQTEYCDVLCRQPSPYNRPEGNSKGTCPLIRFPGGYRPRQTQRCEGSRLEVDKAQWTAKKACVDLVSRPLLRGVRATASGKIWGKQKCLVRHDERVLITRKPLRIDWVGAKVVDVRPKYERLLVELTTADGKKHTLADNLNKHQIVNLYWSRKAHIAKLQPRRRFWWE
jgi:hypothetical protein